MLPPKRQVVLYTGLSDMQKKLYKAILTKNVAALGGDNSRSLVNVISALRKAVNHPYLFHGVEPEPFCEGDHLWQNSGKLHMLERLLPELKKRGQPADV